MSVLLKIFMSVLLVLAACKLNFAQFETVKAGSVHRLDEKYSPLGVLCFTCENKMKGEVQYVAARELNEFDSKYIPHNKFTLRAELMYYTPYSPNKIVAAGRPNNLDEKYCPKGKSILVSAVREEE